MSFLHGDMALQQAMRLAFNVPLESYEKRMREIADGWAQWGAVAAQVLWAYYNGHKS